MLTPQELSEAIQEKVAPLVELEKKASLVPFLIAIAQQVPKLVEALESMALMDNPDWFKSEKAVPMHAAPFSRKILADFSSSLEQYFPEKR